MSDTGIIGTFDELDPFVSLHIPLPVNAEDGTSPNVTGIESVVFGAPGYTLHLATFSGSSITIGFGIGEVFSRRIQYLGIDEQIHTILGPPIFESFPTEYYSPTLYQQLESGNKIVEVSVEYTYSSSTGGGGTSIVTAEFEVQDNWAWANQKLREIAQGGLV